MLDASESNQQKRARLARLEGWRYLGSLVLTFGLAATITSGFGVLGNFITGRQRTQEQKCSIAEQIVLDESASSALNEAQRSRLSTLALRKIEQCMDAMQ